MSTPLIMRIVAKADTAAFDALNQKLKAVGQQAQQTAKESKTLDGAYDNLLKKMRTFAQSGGEKAQFKPQADLLTQMRQLKDSGGQATASKGLFGDSAKQLSGLMQIFKTVRRFGTITGLIATPIILAQKHFEDLDKALKPLTASLTMVGQTSRAETDRLLSFATNLTRSSTTSLKEGIGAITVYVNKIKSAVGVEETLSAAHVLATANGIKLSDATVMITDALNGDTSALANATFKTKAYISELVKSGQLTKTIQKDFKGAAEIALMDLTPFERIKNFISKIPTSGVGKPFMDLFSNLSGRDALKAELQLTQTTNSVLTFKKSLETLATSKISFATLDDFKVQIKETQALIDQAKTALNSPIGNINLDNAAVAAIPKLQERLKILQEQQKLQQELSLPERYQLTTTAEVVKLQAALYTEQNRSFESINESNGSLETQKKLREQLAKAELAQAHASLILSARQTANAQGKALTPEQTISFAAKEIQLRNEIGEKAYRIESSKNLMILRNEEGLNNARLALQQFYFQNRLQQYRYMTRGTYTSLQEELAFEKQQSQLVIDNARKEGLELTAAGRITDADRIRIATETELKLAEVRQRGRENRYGGRLGALSGEEQARVQELLEKKVKRETNSSEDDELRKLEETARKKLSIAKDVAEAIKDFNAISPYEGFIAGAISPEEDAKKVEALKKQLEDMAKYPKAVNPSKRTSEEMIKEAMMFAEPGIADLSKTFQNAFTPDEQKSQQKLKSLLDSFRTIAGVPIEVALQFNMQANAAEFREFVKNEVAQAMKNDPQAQVAAISEQSKASANAA